MVGGNWEKMGDLQFRFMMETAGLRPTDVLLDLGCGSFRGGRHFIEYLESGNYLGLDKQKELIRAGREHEVDPQLWKLKQPEVYVSSNFDFSKFSKQPNVILAQSLLTHLSKRDMCDCLRKVRGFIREDGLLYASFCEGKRRVFYSLGSHSSRDFYYTRGEMAALAKKSGWSLEYIGDWGHHHPHTKMLLFRPRQDQG